MSMWVFTIIVFQLFYIFENVLNLILVEKTYLEPPAQLLQRARNKDGL